MAIDYIGEVQDNYDRESVEVYSIERSKEVNLDVGEYEIILTVDKAKELIIYIQEAINRVEAV